MGTGANAEICPARPVAVSDPEMAHARPNRRYPRRGIATAAFCRKWGYVDPAAAPTCSRPPASATGVLAELGARLPELAPPPRLLK